MNILITGGSGFIGTNLLSFLVEQDYVKNIICLDLVPPKIKNLKISYTQYDIRVEQNLEFDFQIDVCIHLAALCKEPGYNWDEYFATNYLGTQNVVKLIEKMNIKTILFTSTMMVYKAGDKKFNETDLTTPDTAYGISKLLAEEVLLGWSKMSPLNKLLVFRLGVVFGPGENANFSRLIRSLKKGVFAYVGRSSTIKCNIYVKEVINLFNEILLNRIYLEQKIYNFVFDEDSTMKKIVSDISSVLKIKRFIPCLPYPLLYGLSFIFVFLNSIGFKNAIHPRRIQKLYFSTNISSARILQSGYKYRYTLRSSLEDWLKEEKF